MRINHPRNLGKIGDCLRRGADFGEELQAVLADFRIIRIDHDLVEERVDRRAEFGERAHGAGEILDVDGRNRVLLHFLDLGGERGFLDFLEKFQIVRARVGFLVLLFFDGEDIGRALDARKQVRAVIGLEERVQASTRRTMSARSSCPPSENTRRSGRAACPGP